MKSRKTLLVLACAGAALTAPGLDPASAQRPPTCAEIVENEPDFKRFDTAMERVGMRAAMSADGPITVFAVTNNASLQIPGSIRILFADRGTGESASPVGGMATAVADHFVVMGLHKAADLRPGLEMYTNQDAVVAVVGAQGGAPILRIGGYSMRVTKPDMTCRNGVVHGVDFVPRAR
jgi:uncharacterized surface protein with fasciclin (FAS1) repeats